jgi:succinate-acetate transporter protein
MVLYAMPILLIFGGLVQFLAGMWAYRKGDTFEATAFGAFGGFNVTYAAIVGFTAAGLLKGGSAAGSADIIGTTIAMFAFIAFFLAIASARRNLTLFLVLLALTGAYAFDAAGVAGAGTWALQVGGWCGLVSSCLAFYAAAAITINSEARRELLPLGLGQMPSVTVTRRAL